MKLLLQLFKTGLQLPNSRWLNPLHDQLGLTSCFIDRDLTQNPYSSSILQCLVTGTPALRVECRTRQLSLIVLHGEIKMPISLFP